MWMIWTFLPPYFVAYFHIQQEKKLLYNINYGVVQGFPAPRKAVMIRYFFTCVRYHQWAAERHSPFAPLGQADEWTAKPSPFLIQGSLSESSQIMAAKTLKNQFVQTVRDIQTFLWGEENQYTKRKTENYVFGGFGNGISRGWERKSTSGRFARGCFGRLPGRFLLSVRTKSMNENFANWKLRPLLFLLLWFNAFFPSWALAPTHCPIFVRELSIHLFSFINKVGFFVSKYKHNITWLLVDMQFLFSCSTRHLTRSLCSLMSYWVKHSERNSISTRAHVLFSV